jgi:hypothetical protein
MSHVVHRSCPTHSYCPPLPPLAATAGRALLPFSMLSGTLTDLWLPLEPVYGRHTAQHHHRDGSASLAEVHVQVRAVAPSKGHLHPSSSIQDVYCTVFAAEAHVEAHAQQREEIDLLAQQQQVREQRSEERRAQVAAAALTER